ncbi:MAG: GT4 family glycosyltransferase PelF [Fibrobacterota bacterium]
MVDVCLMLEGTYPYVTGGVSSWVNQLIQNLPDTTFGIVHISASRDEIRGFKYKMPANVKQFHEVFLHDYHYDSIPDFKKSSGNWPSSFEVLINSIYSGEGRFEPLFNELFFSEKSPSFEEIFFSEKTWKILLKHYNKEASEESFLDYFWTWRFTMMPFFRMFYMKFPKARLYHSVSTGYAGAAGTAASIRYNRPFIITEHGIYTRERHMEIEEASWITGGNEKRVFKNIDFFKEMWKKTFYAMSRLAYERSNRIITLCSSNMAAQISDGAPPEKCEIIPNGIFFEKFIHSNKKKKENTETVPVIGFAGRVVAIKDIKTLIRSVSIIRDKIECQLMIMGPTDEEPEYYNECLELIHMLALEDTIVFTGTVDLIKIMPEIDILVLTSVSEAQPIVILEANAAGVPVVATDVGACREMLEGENDTLGPGGMVVNVATPEETADAVIDILLDDEKRKEMGRNGRQRVERFYHQQDLLARYNSIYENLISGIN